MFLEKLEIQGFKSFANKNVLVFPGMLDQSRRGITAVVGPNGSGKSNVADSVRWALGEQSMKTLRGKKSEDVIFSGSDKKGKLGMAEVSMYLNNEDKQAPIDYSEIVITRRLYRNGDSEYMLNNNRVRLSDIQMLLAKSKFGQKTYSVIGQGMVEGFLNTSLSERKEFFDEATGVKQFQIKRDDSLGKLKMTYENLSQTEMLLSEIEPRLKSLTRQVNRLKKRGELEGELKTLQLEFYGRVWHEQNNKFNEYNNAYLELEKTKFAKDKKLEALNRELGQLEIETSAASGFVRMQEELGQAQADKDEINKKIARYEAQLEMKLEASGQFDLSYLIGKKEELAQEKRAIEEEVDGLEKNIKADKEKDGELAREKERIDNRIDELNRKLADFNGSAVNDEYREINRRLKVVLEKLRAIGAEASVADLRGLVDSVEREISELLAAGEKLISAETPGGGKGDRLKAIHESLKEVTAEKETLLSRVNDNNLRISARSERVKLLGEKRSGLAAELDNIEQKLKQRSPQFDMEAAEKEKAELVRQLATAEDKIKNIRENISQASAEEEKGKSKLFSLQKELQQVQSEINDLNFKLNDIKINATRYETKLEDLEIEIRQELGGLKEVKAYTAGAGEAADMEAMKDKIGTLKRQLELIGGIDPEIEKEYNDTKERFDFLSGQINDLTDAVESLEQVIKELDITIKERFDKEFKLIADNFEKYFKILFNGGSARVIKVMDTEENEGEAKSGAEEEDASGSGDDTGPDRKADIKKIKFLQKHNATGLAGIEIHATPPGKKIRSIAMLSGGERALTAIALICAIISANPSPFVVLDEVDAALDEANSERLARILDELSHKTQFIVITHNRASMRRANILYGVTMGDDGVSKLLSIKLDEAEKG